jgi:hypothetical protein
MRTTVTLDDDAASLLRRRMREQGISFKQALNDAVRQAYGAPADDARFETPVFDMGVPTVDLDRALQLLAELEDEELIAKYRRGS